MNVKNVNDEALLKIHYHIFVQGRIQDFLNEGAPRLKGLTELGACVDRGCLRGMCLLRSGEKRNFQSQFTRFGAFFLPGSGALSLPKIEGGAPPLNPPRGAGKARFNVATPTNATVTCTAYVLPYNFQTKSI